MADEEPEIEEVLDSLDLLLQKDEADPAAPSQQGPDASRSAVGMPSSPRRMVLTEAMLVEAPDMPSSSTPQPQKPVGETAEKQPEDFSAAPGEVTAPETEPSPAEQHGTAESGPASSPTARGRVSIPESAPEPAPESEAPAPPPGAYERMVDVDVLFGVMSQVAADVSARIADELPDMIEEALNRHLSGLKSDQ